MRPLSTPSFPCQCTCFSSRFQPNSILILQRTVSPSGATGVKGPFSRAHALSVLNNVYIVDTASTFYVDIDATAVSFHNIAHEGVVQAKVDIDLVARSTTHSSVGHRHPTMHHVSGLEPTHRYVRRHSYPDSPNAGRSNT